MIINRIDLFALREPVTPDTSLQRDWWSTTPLDLLGDFAETGGGGTTLSRTARLDVQPQVGANKEEITNVVVVVHTDNGLYGLGNVGVGSPASISVIEHHLAPVLLGQDPFDTERLWQTMYRNTLNIGRKGLVLEAISALDIAIWDILGKATQQPVYNLLGGLTKSSIRAYASQLYAREDLSVLFSEAKGYVDQGFTAVKMRFGYGPQDGRKGMRMNLDLVRTVREAVGDDVDIATEAYLGWDANYAIAMIRELEQFGLAWIEEPVMPDDLISYKRISNKTGIPISGGEHEFTLSGFHQLLEHGAVDILQPDVNRMGGITEARKVWALSQAYGVPVIPHSNQSHNAHLIISSVASPLIEYFPDNGVRTGYNLYYEYFHGTPRPVNGRIAIGSEPGLGVTLNADAIHRHCAFAISLSAGGRQSTPDTPLSFLLEDSLSEVEKGHNRVAN